MLALDSLLGKLLDSVGEEIPEMIPSPEVPITSSPMEPPQEDSKSDKKLDKQTTYEESTDMTVLAEDGQGKDKSQLFHMGATTALAIALHNMPEGLVTFVGYMDDPAIGVTLAVGIAIHNIPEGLCVAMPIYYATGDKMKAFRWGALSGVTEPLGALLGWVIFNSSVSGNTYGTMFGVVSGIMTTITLDELLPTAHRYDPDGGRRITYMVLIGMFAVAFSLMMFSI